MHKIITENELSHKLDLEKYNELIVDIKNTCKNIGIANTFNIFFDKTITFINPAFIILLYNLYEKLKLDNVKLLIDITNLPDSGQHAFLNHIQQFIDYGIIKKEHKLDMDNNPIKTDLKNIKEVSLSTYRKIVVYYATTVKHYDIQLNIEKNYNHLPLVKITNNEEFEFNSFKTDNNDYRKNYYERLQLVEGEKHRFQFIGKGQNDDVWALLFSQYLNLYENDIDTVKALQNILFEITDNIKKHTEINNNVSNGYISFYKNNTKDSISRNEFFICDDYEKGFLSTYLETMHKEKNAEKNREALEEYDNIIKLLEEDSEELKKYEYELSIGKDVNEIVLEKIFSSYYAFSTQKKRIVKHFGIPLLLKLLLDINKNCIEKEKAIFQFYVHRKEQSYCVSYEDGIAKARKLENTLIKGTYIYISFPTNIRVINKTVSDEPVNIHTAYYKDIFKYKDIIDEKSKNIKELSIEELKSKKLPINTKDNEQPSVLVGYQKNQNASDFLRYVYSYAYLRENSIQDIVVVNFDIKSYINYLEIYKESALLEKINNILFIDSSSPLVMFIGGKTTEKMYLINNFLSNNYNYDKTNISNTMTPAKGENIKIHSNLFFNYEEEIDGKNIKKTSFIPIDLFKKINNQYLYAYMIDNMLNIEKKDYHVDIGGGKHISSFYPLKYIFEDSTWIGRIAFNLARSIKENSIFIGVEAYASLIIDKAIEISGFKLDKYIIYDFEDEENFRNYIKGINKEKIIFFCPVITDSKQIGKFIDLLDCSKKYSAVKLDYHGCNNNSFEHFLVKDVNDIINSSDTCKDCFGNEKVGDRDRPLYTLDEDGFSLKNIFTDNIKLEKQLFSDLQKKRVNWSNSVYFGHVERANNHYLYYTKTLIFLEQNRKEIEYVYRDLKNSNKIQITNDEIPVILTPLHQTNNEFVLLIDKIIFNNDATIHYFGSLNKKQKHKNIQKLKEKYAGSSSYKFYFVDDEISSGSTIKDFYKLLRNILEKETLYTGVFSLINRASIDDAEILSKFAIKDSYYIYNNLNISPIKIEEDNCYLCERKKKFRELTKNSSLVFIKNQFRKKVKDLKIKDSKYIEKENLNNKDIKDFKNYLKMFAVEYIYNNLSKSVFIEKLLTDFKVEVKDYFNKIYLNDEKDDNFSIVVNKMIDFEAEIALVKALYFPNISHYIQIRESVHQFVFLKLKELRKSLFDLITKEIKIESIFSKEDLKSSLKYKKNKNIREFILHYLKMRKTEIDRFNFYIITSAYLNINYVLDKEMIEFYYCLSKKVRSLMLNIKLLHKYPVAVKMLISYSYSKANYFNGQLDKFTKIRDRDNKNIYTIKYTKDFSLINALYVENNLLLKTQISFPTIDKMKKRDLTSLINEFKSSIINYLNSDILNNISFFIDTNPLENEERLIDIFDSYMVLDKNVLIDEYNIYKGVASDKDNKTNEIKIALTPALDDESKNNIWSNYYDIENNKSIIRITHTTKTKLNFKAVGVLVVYHNQNSLSSHLDISRKILKNQEHISKFIKDYILNGIIAEKENRFLIEQAKKTTKIIENINHTYRKFNKYSVFLPDVLEAKDSIEDLIKYSKGIELNSVIGSINEHLIMEYKKLDKLGENSNYYTLNDDFSINSDNLLKLIQDFFIVCPKYLHSSLKISKNATFSITVNNVNEFDFEYFTGSGVNEEIIQSVFFEFIFNAIKNNKDGSEILITIKSDEVYIENSGECIPLDKRNTIFDKGTTGNKNNGLGMGLSAIKEFLELFSLTVECVNPISLTHQTCFKIYKKE
ncbi:ATP-binding protein [Aliarcobacter butzleri]|uniref:ATP-binding protein n=1 Tax=Aliarcobacter butzleri TaxID=28197 RepID=UPI001EDC2B89|nr:ATP-binding protein [Aliarcobacter butzleri]MCG3691098.1 ATP-binding protein [Aliarcobacter butzleri]